MHDIDRRMISAIRNRSKDAKPTVDFDESKHPRSPDGKFSSGGGGNASPKKTFSLAQVLPKKTEREIRPTTQAKNFYGEHTLKGTVQELNKWGNERTAAWKQYLLNPTKKNGRTLMRQYIDNPQYYEQDAEPVEDGGKGSGNWGHKGRIGKRGGSGKGGGTQYREGTKEEGFKKKTLSLAEVAQKMQSTPRSTPFARKRGAGERFVPQTKQSKPEPYNRPKAQQRALNSIIRKTSNLKKEQMRIVDQDGNILLTKKGEKGLVAATVGEKREFLKGNTSIHNHPDGGTFSPDDLSDFGYGARDIVVASPEGTYTLVNSRYGTPQQFDGWNEMKQALQDSLPKDDMGFSKVNPLELRKQARQNLKDSPENKQLAEITAKFMEVQKNGSRDEWMAFAQEVKPRMDELTESIKRKTDAEVRRLQVKPYDDFYKAHAAEYGFEYTFTPAKNVASQATTPEPEYATMSNAVSSSANHMSQRDILKMMNSNRPKLNTKRQNLHVQGPAHNAEMAARKKSNGVLPGLLTISLQKANSIVLDRIRKGKYTAETRRGDTVFIIDTKQNVGLWYDSFGKPQKTSKLQVSFSRKDGYHFYPAEP